MKKTGPRRRRLPRSIPARSPCSALAGAICGWCVRAAEEEEAAEEEKGEEEAAEEEKKEEEEEHTGTKGKAEAEE